jgi:hypothetical protein
MSVSVFFIESDAIYPDYSIKCLGFIDWAGKHSDERYGLIVDQSDHARR